MSLLLIDQTLVDAIEQSAQVDQEDDQHSQKRRNQYRGMTCHAWSVRTRGSSCIKVE
jgi:hypothetical protein